MILMKQLWGWLRGLAEEIEERVHAVLKTCWSL